MPDQHSGVGKGPRRGRRWRRFALSCLVLFLGSWLVWSAGTSALAVPNRAYVIPTNSMAPTLKPGDRIAVRAGALARPRRGEIWVFRMPKSAALGAASDAVKRIMGLP